MQLDILNIVADIAHQKIDFDTGYREFVCWDLSTQWIGWISRLLQRETLKGSD